MTIAKARPTDVLGHLKVKVLVGSVTAIFGQKHGRYLVQRYHAEKFGIKPDEANKAATGGA